MKTKKECKIVGIVVAVLLVIAAFADLQISRAIYNSGSMFGKLFEAVGEFPASLIASFCAVSVAIVQKKRNDGKVNGKCVGSFVLGVLLALMAGVLPVTYLNGPKALGIVLAVLIFAAEIWAAKYIARYRKEELYKAAVMGLQLFFLVLLLFNLMKLGWGRERYRHMVEIGSAAGFSAWYIPQGIASGNEFMSFPSGHSANAAIIMWITMLPTFLTSLAKKETLLKVAAYIWIALVMVSRIIMGAHFLSDVTMGMTISLVTFYVLYRKKYQ